MTRLLPNKVRKKRGRGRPFVSGNPWRFPLGKSPNPGGRKRLLDAHVESLAAVDSSTGKTVAQLVSEKMCELAVAGDISAARELRQATEGDKMVFTQKHDVREMSDDDLSSIANGESK